MHSHDGFIETLTRQVLYSSIPKYVEHYPLQENSTFLETIERGHGHHVLNPYNRPVKLSEVGAEFKALADKRLVKRTNAMKKFGKPIKKAKWYQAKWLLPVFFLRPLFWLGTKIANYVSPKRSQYVGHVENMNAIYQELNLAQNQNPQAEPQHRRSLSDTAKVADALHLTPLAPNPDGAGKRVDIGVSHKGGERKKGLATSSSALLPPSNHKLG